MNKEIKGIEEKIENKRLQIEKACKFYANILENLTDEGSTIGETGTGVVLYLPIEKINFLLNELNNMKKDIERIDFIEGQIFGDEEVSLDHYLRLWNFD